MPGTILLEDAQKFYTDRLQQHAQDALQAVQQANEPPLRNAVAPALPNPQVDPNAIVQRLQQFGQDAFQAAQQANQPPLQGVQLDPNAITERLQQHAQDAFQAVDQTVQPISQGLQQAVQPVAQAVDQSVQQANQPPFQNAVQPTTPTVDRGGDLRTYARQAAQRAGIDPDIFVRQIEQESGFDPTAKSPAGAQGIAQFMPGTAAGLKLDPSDPYASLDAAAQLDAQNLARYGGDYAKALAAYNAGGGNVDKYGGVPPFAETQDYVKTILGGAKQAVGNVVQGAQQAVSNVLPALSQFGDKQLTAAEAYSACGPAAAVRFAQMFGRNPTLREATDLAQSVGWTAEQGMAGLRSESQLFTEMGIPHRVVGADWQALAREAQSGNPVTISTPGHYFTADSYDPRSGAFHVGSSGTDLRGGAEWMTPEQMEARMGALQGGLAADNPGTPAPSPIAGGTTPTTGAIGQVRQAVQQGGRAIQGGLQQVDRAVQGVVQGVQGAAADVGTRARQTAQDVQQAVTEPLPQRAADLAGQVPLLGGGTVSDLAAPARGIQDLAGQVQVPETDNLAAKAAGTGLSALGTVARAANDQLDRLNIVSTAAREAAGEDVYGQKYAAAGGPQLEDEYRQLLAQRMSGDDSGNARMVEIVNQLQQINDTIRAGRPQSEVNQALSAENPLTPVSTTLANLGALMLAAPLAAGDAPVAARALAEILQPGTNPVQLAQALRIVNDTPATARALVDTIDQMRKMPGTAELAPVRAQVTQSSTDLLQAMLDAARAKGADPDKLAALEQQITQMDPTAATRRALTPVTAEAGGVRGAVGNFLTGTGSELGAANPRVAATLGGAVAGGVAGNATTPEDALTIPTPAGDIPIERGVRIAAGAGLGAGLGSAVAGFRGPLEQQVLQNLRSGGLVAGPAVARPVRGPIAEAVDLTKQSILTNPATHIANVIGNTIELGRQPISLAMGGRGDDALVGLSSVMRGVPEAAANAVSAMFKGQQLATLGTAASTIPRRSQVFRALSAADAFTRTLGEYQGMASEANRLLREAGMTPRDPGAAEYLASHAADLYRAGTRSGAQSVFGRVATEGQGTGVLDNIFRTYANAKEGLLNSPRLRDQAMGALMDFGIPFSGVPVQMLQIGLNRLPVAAQTTGAIRAVRALRAGNMGEAQRAVGETGLESALQLMIAKNVADGNITGPDDPIHANSVKVGGNWVSMNEWGAYALPMQIMASFADGFEKGGQDVPPTTPGASPLEQAVNYYGPRFNAALNASLKPFQQGIPGENLIRLVSNIGQGGATAGALGLAQDAINRITVPGAARFVENLTDPVAREIDRKGVSSLWEGTMANWPGLAEQLPAKIDPTTGEVLSKARTGPGILVGTQQDIASPITLEANRLKKEGYSGITPPTTYADTVSYQGAQIKLNPTEKRAVAQATGHILGDFAQRLSESDYQQSDDDRKARLMQAYIAAADQARLRAWAQLVGPDAARTRLIAAERTVGRLNAQATPPAFVAPSFLSSSSQSAQEQQAVGAGR